LYHRLDHLVLGGHGARHLQLYFYDTEDEALSHRVKRSPDLYINLIQNIIAILQDNPYVHTFRRNSAFPNLNDYRCNSIQISRLTREGTMPQWHPKLLISGWKGMIHKDVLIEVWLYMERQIVVHTIFEHTMVGMTH
jgi:hypothetical protein